MLSETDRAQALLYGLACGDALGYRVEFVELARIKAEYGPEGIRDLPRQALYTDDTQMTLALARALVAHGADDLDTLMDAVTREFVVWRNTQDDPAQSRAPGNACLSATARLRAGTATWRDAGEADSKGCGAVMRVAPVGYVYQHDVVHLQDVARAQALATHGHPASTAASIGAAYLVKLALDGLEPIEMPYRMLELVGDLSRDVTVVMGRTLEVSTWPDEELAIRHIGKGWVAEEALALAFYCFLRHPDDYVRCIVRAANIDGDSDSVACIAGALAAARIAAVHGRVPVPSDWVGRIENTDEIAAIAGGLAAVKARIGAAVK
jgi:ADP-ribosylglycohydrolase